MILVFQEYGCRGFDVWNRRRGKYSYGSIGCESVVAAASIWHRRCNEESTQQVNATRRTLMVNTKLFQTLRVALLPDATAANASRAPAYAYTPRHQLAQLAATGCLGSTFHANAETQLESVLALAAQLGTAFVAKTPLPAREA